MKVSERERRLIAVLGVMAVVVGGWWLLRQGGGLAGLPAELGGGGAVVDLDGYDVAVLDIAALQSGPSEYPVGRNPWTFGKPPPPPPRETPVRPPRTEPVRPRNVPVSAPVEQGPPPRQLPQVDVTFIGSFGPDERKIAVFTDGEDTIYNLQIGDVLKDSFRVHQIGFESVDLAYVEFPEEPPARLALGDS